MVAAEELVGALTVEDGTALRFSSVDVANFEILEGLEPEDDWIGTIIAFVGTLAAGLDEGSITVNPAGEVVTTAGEADTRQLKRDLTDASEDLVVALGTEGFDVTDGVLGPPKPPALTKADVEELERTLAEVQGEYVAGRVGRVEGHREPRAVGTEADAADLSG